MLKKYIKKPLSFEEQLNLLQKRGMVIYDRTSALNTLSEIGYYRLSAYWHSFRQRDNDGRLLDDFVLGSSFKEILTRYEFDRKLRLLVLDGIERIEVSMRTKLTYYLSHQYGVYGHTVPSNFHPSFDHNKWLEELEQREVKRSQEKFIQHFKKNYQGFPALPIWMSTEVMSFGLLSKFFCGLKNKDKRAISKEYKIHYKTLTDWLHVLTYVRNICAHHGRLYNCELAIRPVLKGLDKEWLLPTTPNNSKLYIVLLIMNRLLKVNSTNQDWQKNLEGLISPMGNAICKAIGFPIGWQDHILWKPFQDPSLVIEYEFDVIQ